MTIPEGLSENDANQIRRIVRALGDVFDAAETNEIRVETSTGAYWVDRDGNIRKAE